MYDNLPPVSDFIARHKLAAKKSLGQNFILDLNLTDKIARAVPNIGGRTVVEIGSGPAGLTRSLLKNGANVVAIELDPRAVGVLEELRMTYGDRIRIIAADALEVDYAEFQGASLCANLPYNISIPLLVRWLHGGWFDDMTLMFQREVADRIVATSGKDYGRISILVALTYKARILFNVPGTAFSPPPKVRSAVVGFTRLPHRPTAAILRRVDEVVALAFQGRRKMLRQSLKDWPLAVAGIDETLRPENLSPATWLKLAEHSLDIATNTP